MSSKTWYELLQEVNALTTDEQLRLAAYLVERAREACPSPIPRRPWRELHGLIPAGSLGEDAQVWVSRMRREADQRDRLWTKEP